MGVKEHCREWITEDGWGYCHEQADLILWGKLFPQDALGPRCMQHAALHIRTDDAATIEQGAVYDLRPVYVVQADAWDEGLRAGKMLAAQAIGPGPVDHPSNPHRIHA